MLVVAEPPPPDPEPARLVVSRWRVDERSPLCAAKTANYLPSLLARSEARAAGYDEALMRCSTGDVSEAATSNVFAVFGERLVTPPLEAGPLPGVTRATLLTLAQDAGIEAVEQPLPLETLAAADELLLTNSAAGVWPVAQLDGPSLRWRPSSVPGPVTTALDAGYRALVRAECGVE